MAGVTVSFTAEPELAARVKEAARIDGVTQSQAAARAAASGVLLSPAARRSLRFALEEGGAEARRELSVALSRAVTQVASAVLKRQLMERVRASGEPPASGQDILDEATDATLLAQVEEVAGLEHRPAGDVVREAVALYLRQPRQYAAAPPSNQARGRRTAEQAVERILEQRKGNVLPEGMTIRELMTHGRA